MSSTRPLLVDSSSPGRDERYEDLLRKCTRLQDDLEELKLKLQEERNRSAKLMRAQVGLRQQLNPLFKAIRMVMEELPDDSPIDANPQPQAKEVWEIQKRLFPGRPAEFIDLLLVRPMNTTELATAARCDPRTVTKAIFTLNKAGLVSKNGGVFSLKQL